jgi:hypothetical protein
MGTATTITIELWALIVFLATLLLAFFGAVWAFARLVLKQFSAYLDQRFKARDERLAENNRAITQRFDDHSRKLAKVDEHSQDIEREILRLRAELPENYVRREDWIRFSATIDAKLDWLRTHCEDTRRLIVGVSEQVKSLRPGGKPDGG